MSTIVTWMNTPTADTFFLIRHLLLTLQPPLTQASLYSEQKPVVFALYEYYNAHD